MDLDELQEHVSDLLGVEVMVKIGKNKEIVIYTSCCLDKSGEIVSLADEAEYDEDAEPELPELDFDEDEDLDEEDD